jgi:C-terminal processing protease CtpA/Prc
MKYSIAILLTILFTFSCRSQKNENVEFDPIVLSAKETSLYTDQIDWVKVNKKYVELTQGKTKNEDLKEGLQFLINSLGDKHGTFRSSRNGSIVASYTGEIKGKDVRVARFVNEVINDESARFSYRQLNKGVGYLKIVGIGPGNIKAEADLIRNGVLELKRQGTSKWVVDLRYNGGGDMNPMISGLAPLIGNGFIGGSMDNKGAIQHEYMLKDGQFYDNGNLVCEMENLPVIDQYEKIAVLVSRYTISSGEMVAVAFKGKENTLFIGEPSAGYTTGNGWNQVTDDLIMNISQGVYIDRNKKVYQERVGVDEEIEFQHLVDLNDDAQIKRAIEWLSKKY